MIAMGTINYTTLNHPSVYMYSGTKFYFVLCDPYHIHVGGYPVCVVVRGNCTVYRKYLHV